MSSRLPLQSRVVRPKFQNKKAIFGDDEDEDEKINDERILGIEDNKVREAEPKKEVAPPSISPLPNADWRSTAKHKKELFLPATAKQPLNGGMDAKPEVLEQNPSSFGLQVQKKKQHIKTMNSDGHVESVSIEETETTKSVENAPKTLEQRAIEAIIKDSMGQGDDDDAKNQGSRKVIQVDETSAFREDYQKRPDETTMEEYENIPVEEFGAALLRGLGWNEGQGIGRNRKNAPAPPPAAVKQREALLGLGAKPEDANSKTDEKQKFKNRRAAYEYKDTSLFKKISKRKYNEHEQDDDDDGKGRSSSRHRDRSASSSSSSRRDNRDDDGKRSRKRRSRSRDSSSSSKSHHTSRRRRRSSHSRSRSPVPRSSRSYK